MDDPARTPYESRGSNKGTMISSPAQRKKVSQAQRVVANARARQQKLGNVAALPSTRLERRDVNGSMTMAAVFPSKGGGKSDELDLSHLLNFPGLCDLFSLGILECCRTLDQKSRLVISRSLRRYWFGYLQEGNLSKITPTQLDDQVMTGFKAWLHRQKKANGQPLHPNTIRQSLGALRRALAGAGESELESMVPAGPRGARRKTEPTKVLVLEELMAVMAAVEKEVIALRERWTRRCQLFAQGRQRLDEHAVLESRPWSRKEARSDANLALALAMLDQRYPGVIPDQSVISTDDPLLGQTVQYALGSTAVAGYFYATARDLVPLALSLAFATVFNPETVLKLKWKNIDRNVDRIGNGRPAVRFDVEDDDDGKAASRGDDQDAASPLTKVTGDKPRARRQLVRLLDPEASSPDQVNLNLVLDLLTELTRRIRPSVVADSEYEDCVFLFVQRTATKRPKGFGSSKHAASGDAPWETGLKNFIADNHLPDFTLKTIRATLLDYVQLFNRGDLDAAREAGDHSTRVTTWTHYTSHLVKRLLRESTGETLLVRDRWLQSHGIIDSRKHRDWTNKGCATPGFFCLDPFDSPRPNQKYGRLCDGYGECPDCPLAAANPNHPRHVMLYEALKRAIYRSVTTMTASMWQMRWAAVMAALEGLLLRVPEAVLEKSRQIKIELPNVG
jgi:hypothetical protein